MTDLGKLNNISRAMLAQLLVANNESEFKNVKLPELLTANFLREISDSLNNIFQELSGIHDKLSGLEMNTRPKP